MDILCAQKVITQKKKPSFFVCVMRKKDKIQCNFKVSENYDRKYYAYDNYSYDSCPMKYPASSLDLESYIKDLVCMILEKKDDFFEFSQMKKCQKILLCTHEDG